MGDQHGVGQVGDVRLDDVQLDDVGHGGALEVGHDGGGASDERNVHNFHELIKVKNKQIIFYNRISFICHAKI